MTTTATPAPPVTRVPPFSRAVRIGTGACLVLAGLLNGLPQATVGLLAGGRDFSEQIAWGASHEIAHRTEQTLLVVSALFLPLGLLGLAQVSRWGSPRLTAVGLPLALWGMWGFHNVLAMGYVAGTVTPGVLGVEPAVALNDGLVTDPGVVGTALVPHLLGSFLGMFVLMLAAWRSGRLPRAACALVMAFLVWDFLLPTGGLLQPHLLLAVGLGWLGVRIARMGPDAWAGRPY
jgi:hypothetical protein